jgi:hypothetical protein
MCSKVALPDGMTFPPVWRSGPSKGQAVFADGISATFPDGLVRPEVPKLLGIRITDGVHVML